MTSAVATIGPQTPLRQVLEFYPGAQRALFKRYHIGGCSSCAFQPHETVQELAENASVPVINALSDREHPVQAFADLLTLEEHRGPLGNNLKLAYVGDGNNVAHSLLLCA